MSTWSDAHQDYTDYQAHLRDARAERDLFAHWWSRDRRLLGWLVSITTFLAGLLLGGPLWRLLGGA